MRDVTNIQGGPLERGDIDHGSRPAATDEARGFTRLYIIDPAFDPTTGHYRGYGVALLDAARDEGLSTALLCPKGTQAALNGHAVHDLLNQDFWSAFLAVAGGEDGGLRDSVAMAVSWRDALIPQARGWSRRMRQAALAPLAAASALTTPAWTASGLRQAAAVRRLRRDLEAAEARLGRFGPEVLLVFPNAFTVELEAWLDLIADRDDPPRAAFLMRRDLQVEGRTPAPVMRRRARRLARAVGQAPPHTGLLTDTESLAEQYAEVTGRRFGVAPVPITCPGSVPKAAPKGAVRVVYLGGARAEKGFDRLAGLVRERPPRPSRRYRFQGGEDLGGDSQSMTPEIQDARRAIASAARPYLRLEANRLVPEAYAGLLADADVALLPYDRDAYRRRSSGVLVEALAAGVTPIVTSGTWMAEVVQSFEQAHLAGLAARGAGQVAVIDIAGRPRWIEVEVRGQGGEARRLTRRAGAPLRVALDPARAEAIASVADEEGRPVEAAIRIVAAPALAPRSAVGVIVETPDDLAKALDEVEAHLDHYRQAASRIAPAWRSERSGQALLDAFRLAGGSH